MKDPPPRKQSWQAQAGEWMALGFVLPASIFVGYAIGYLLDKAFGTHWLYMVFLLLGIAGGFVQLLRGVDRLNKRNG